MSNNIAFLTEGRTEFNSNPNPTGDAKIVGSFPAKEILICEKWREAEQATVKFYAEFSWIISNLSPGIDPKNPTPPYRKARYFSVRNKDGRFKTFIVDSFNAAPSGEKYEVTVIGYDPRYWLEKTPGYIYPGDSELVGTRSSLLYEATKRASNTLTPERPEWVQLPVEPLDINWDPSDEEIQVGYVKPLSADPGGNININNSDPAPVFEQIKSIEANWENIELYPQPQPGFDGTSSPFWRWTVRRRISKAKTFSTASGNLLLKNIKSDLSVNEFMEIDTDNSKRFAFGGNEKPLNSFISGPWLGVKVNKMSTPEDASNRRQSLFNEAYKKTSLNKRLTFEAEINLTDIPNIMPGMFIWTRFDDRSYQVPVEEIISTYKSDVGWRSNSSIFIEVDSLNAQPPFIERDILLELTMTEHMDPIFNIPTYGGEPYDWSVYLNDGIIGRFTGTAPDNYQSIKIDLEDGPGTYILRIKPYDDNFYAGWGRAFTYRAGNSWYSRDMVTKVLSNPEYAHLQSETNTGHDFMRSAYMNLMSLKSIPDENLPNTVTTIGDYYKADICSGLGYIDDYYDPPRYYGLEKGGEENIPNSVTSVGEYFRMWEYSGCVNLKTTSSKESSSTNLTGYLPKGYRYEQYRNCVNLLEAPDEHLPGTITALGIQGFGAVQFRERQYANCSSLERIPKEDFPQTVTHIWSSGFRTEQYLNCVSLNTPVEEAVFNGVHMESDFRTGQFKGCTSITTVLNEGIGNNLIRMGSRMSQFEGCTSLVNVPEFEVMPDTVTTLNNGYRSRQFFGCTSLLSPMKEVYSENLITAGTNERVQQYEGSGIISLTQEGYNPGMTTGINYRKRQYANCINLKRSAVEAIIQPTGADFRMEQYFNCINLEENYPERSLPQSPLPARYRFKQFAHCVSLGPEIWEQQNIQVHDKTATKGQNYRISQYGDTLCGPANDKSIYYTDGTKVTQGQNGISSVWFYGPTQA